MSSSRIKENQIKVKELTSLNSLDPLSPVESLEPLASTSHVDAVLSVNPLESIEQNPSLPVLPMQSVSKTDLQALQDIFKNTRANGDLTQGVDDILRYALASTFYLPEHLVEQMLPQMKELLEDYTELKDVLLAQLSPHQK